MGDLAKRRPAVSPRFHARICASDAMGEVARRRLAHMQPELPSASDAMRERGERRRDDPTPAPPPGLDAGVDLAHVQEPAGCAHDDGVVGQG
jgi:hypothetical protein